MNSPCALLVIVVPILLVGCAGNKTDTRKREKAAAYAGLPAAHQRLVDEGKIDVGMSADAVYIAWGKPAMTVPTTPGNFTWIYRCNDTDAYSAWQFRPLPAPGRGTYYTVERGTRFVGIEFDCAEVNFEGGVVKNWRKLPKPER